MKRPINLAMLRGDLVMCKVCGKLSPIGTPGQRHTCAGAECKREWKRRYRRKWDRRKAAAK